MMVSKRFASNSGCYCTFLVSVAAVWFVFFSVLTQSNRNNYDNKHATWARSYHHRIRKLEVKEDEDETKYFVELKAILNISKALLGITCTDSTDCLSQFQARQTDALLKQAVNERLLQYTESLARDRAAMAPHQLYENVVTNTTHVLTAMNASAMLQSEWKNELFPDIVIAGTPKGGTSQLAFILESHPQATKFDPANEEECFDPHFLLGETLNETEKNDLQSRLFTYFSHKEVRNSNLKTVSACFSADDIILRANYLQSDKPKRILYLLRDPADWLWAAWNFWTDDTLDTSVTYEGQWTKETVDYRSPELFHELMASGERSVPGERLVVHRQVAVDNLRKLIEAFGRENVLILRNEDMLPEVIDEKGGFLDQLSSFTGLSRNGYPVTATKSIHNCNDHKGKGTSCGTTKTTRYGISGHRPMFEETRRLIYLYFHEECKIWKNEFGVEYPDCLNVLQ